MIKLKNKKLSLINKKKQLGEIVARNREVEALFLFGSFAQKESTPLSDIDLAFLPSGKISKAESTKLDNKLYIKLAQSLSTDDITLVNLNEAPLTLAYNIIRHKPLFCRDEATLAKYKEKILSLYPEVKRMQDNLSAAYLENLKAKL
jgi:predicted nucleotidyltransferase